ncbi:hypothetical protein SUGI_0709790 [Cryptomeria japonica]|nr:hypothetical protein SUGI_0709790 [Cryptomeria japonica]
MLSDPDDRRFVMASLVEGVYVQERNRQENGLDRDSEMEMWWTFFNFNVLHHLFDRADGSIFGAVYKWNKPATGGGAPEIVVAFRGTIRKVESLARDLLHSLNILTKYNLFTDEAPVGTLGGRPKSGFL